MARGGMTVSMTALLSLQVDSAPFPSDFVYRRPLMLPKKNGPTLTPGRGCSCTRACTVSDCEMARMGGADGFRYVWGTWQGEDRVVRAPQIVEPCTVRCAPPTHYRT